jgi:hypothetical protein
VWHVLTHPRFVLWRFHLFIMVDRDLDASDRTRFHAGELALLDSMACDADCGQWRPTLRTPRLAEHRPRLDSVSSLECRTADCR